MFGLKKLRKKIVELESEVARLTDALSQDRELGFDENCDHEYQMVCAVTFRNTALVETGGLYSYSHDIGTFTKTYYHPCVDPDPNSNVNLVALYAYKCKNCHRLAPATCFDVASVADCEWIVYDGPHPYRSLKYMMCTATHVVKSKKPNKLDTIVDECEKNDKAS